MRELTITSPEYGERYRIDRAIRDPPRAAFSTSEPATWSSRPFWTGTPAIAA